MDVLQKQVRQPKLILLCNYLPDLKMRNDILGRTKIPSFATKFISKHRMLEERYETNSDHVRFCVDQYLPKNSIYGNKY